MDKADKFTSDLLEKVMKQQAEQREKADELERQRMKLEEEKAKRESERDEQFMTLLEQLVAMVRPPQPQPMGFPVPLPPPSPPMPRPPPLLDPYGTMYSFPCSKDDEDDETSE